MAVVGMIVAGAVVLPAHDVAVADDPAIPSCGPHPAQTYDRDTGTVIRTPWPEGKDRTCVERHAAGTLSGSGSGVPGGEVTFTLSGAESCGGVRRVGCYGSINFRKPRTWRFYIPGNGGEDPRVVVTSVNRDDLSACSNSRSLTCTVTLPNFIPVGATHLIARAEVTLSVETPPELCQDRDRWPDAPGCWWVSPDGREARWVPDVSEVWAIEVAFPLVESPNTPPVAGFVFESAATGPNDISFTSTAFDAEDPREDLAHFWDFGDGETSTQRDPVHRFPGPGTYQVTLRVTDTDAGSTSRTIPVTIGGTVVNSSGDAPATDAAATGCDTGGTIGDDPECTLRAALETVASQGGGEITFDIDGGGVPTIAVGEDPLPAVPASTTIDGTSQPAGLVAVDGGGAEQLLTLTGAGTTVKGLVLDDATSAIYVDGADEATITGNVLGADATGTSPGSVDVGVQVRNGEDVTVSKNVIGAETGVLVWNVASGAEITDNAIGVATGGGAVLGATRVGVAAIGPDAVVKGNTVHGSEVGIGILTAAATGAEVRANRVGVAGGANVVLDGAGQGVRIDGAPKATVADNVISSARDDVAGDIGAVVVTGGRQVFDGPDGLVFPNRNGGAADSPPTATEVAITGNVIGDSAVTGGEDESGAQSGILAWGAPRDLEVLDNVIAGPERGVELYGGAGHSVLGNRIGIDAGDAPHPVETVGVVSEGATDTTVGAEGRGNTIRTEAFGIIHVGGSVDGAVVGNEITAVGDTTNCISVENDADRTTVEANTVVDCRQGITVKDSAQVAASRNVVQDPQVGLLVEGEGATAETNVVLGAELQAFIVRATGVTLDGNLVGTTGRAAAIQPFEGEGIRFQTGSGVLRNNVVVGADGAAIAVNADEVVTLRGNRLEDIEQRPIVAPNGPDRPTIAAAIRSTAPDSSTRTTLVITDLPDGDAGEVEVFANDDCDPDGEAHEVLGVVKAKKIDRTTMVVQLIDRDDDNFTATYTDAAGTTSELSTCAPIVDHPDSDGDGSVDPLDDLVGGTGDPTRGVVITDDAQILQVSTNSGRLTGLAAVDDPAPGGHPTVDLPYGTVRFSVEELAPGGAADVTFLVVDGDALQPESTYWKFGSSTPGAAPAWFDFSYDEATGLGARTLDPVDVGGLGLRRPLQVSFQDGARGDADGTPDGTVTDPGAIAVPNGTEPDEPDEPDVPGPDDPADPVSTPEALAPPADVPPPVGSGTLPRTGASVLDLVATAMVLALAGIACASVAVASRRSTRDQRCSAFHENSTAG